MNELLPDTFCTTNAILIPRWLELADRDGLHLVGVVEVDADTRHVWMAYFVALWVAVVQTCDGPRGPYISQDTSGRPHILSRHCLYSGHAFDAEGYSAEEREARAAMGRLAVRAAA